MHTCISSHGLKRSWRSCPRRVNAGNKNTPRTHHPRRRNVTTLMVGLKNGHIRRKSHPKMVNPRDIAGESRRSSMSPITEHFLKENCKRCEMQRVQTRMVYLQIAHCSVLLLALYHKALYCVQVIFNTSYYLPPNKSLFIFTISFTL